MLGTTWGSSEEFDELILKMMWSSRGEPVADDYSMLLRCGSLTIWN